VICVDATDLGATRPLRPLYTSVSVTVSTGDRLGVVGLNGSGKSTLLRVLAGEAPPESGTVRFGRGVRIGFLPQDPRPQGPTVRDAVGDGWEAAALLERIGMGGLASESVATLSGGQRKRVALAALLAREHDLLVLDEPTNHLDLDAIAFLEDRLAGLAGAVVLVTHDRHVLDRVTTRVLELEAGRGYVHEPRGEHAGSGYAAYLAGRAERAERAVAAEAKRRNLARAELAWLRRGAPARTAKPKARIEAAERLIAGGPAAAARQGELGLRMGTARLGSKAVELHGVSFTWPGAAAPVLAGVQHLIEPGDRVGVVGPNGAGKTTLLELIAGRVAPTVGRVERGTTVVVGYYDQTGATLDVGQRVRDAVAGPDGVVTPEHLRLMERFWFDADAQWAEIGTLSGGERRRLQLLLVLAAQPNVLLLDEPTNDLDLDTLRALEDFLEDWPGSLVVVSHDRTFLDRTVSDVLAIEAGGRVREVRGGYAGWLSERAGASSPGGAGRARVERADAPAPPPSGATRSPSTMRRLLSAAERDVAAATAERERLASAVAAPGVGHAELARLGHDLAEADARLAAAEEAWLALAAEAEAAGLAV
jgi:ATP-binding cassette subfamily F protein uup